MKIFYTLMFLLLILTVKGQDAQFSQYYANPIYLAPSFAGSAHGTRFVGNFRDQWPNIPGTFISYSFSFDQYFNQINSGMGLSFFSDNAGDGKLVTNNIAFSYSYKVRIKHKLYFQPGLAAYYYNRRINYSMLSFADQYFGTEYVGSTTESLNNQYVQHADFAVSGLIYSDMFWGGFTIDHLMQLSPVLRNDYNYSNMRFTLYGGKKFGINRTLRARSDESVSLTFKYNFQSGTHQLDVGAYYTKKIITVGLWYRGIPIGNTYNTSDALIYLFGIKLNELSINYSFDMTIGKLISSTGGAHEVSIIYVINNKSNSKRRKYKTIPCPEF